MRVNLIIIARIWLLGCVIFLSELSSAGPECKLQSDYDKYYPSCIREVIQKFPEEFLSAAELMKFSAHTRKPSTCGNNQAPLKDSVSALKEFANREMPRVYKQLADQSTTKLQDTEIRSALDTCMARERRYHELARQASDHVYNLTTIDGYEVDAAFEYNETGLKAYLLKPKNPNEPAIIAFSGTENDTDVDNDFQWALPQMKNAQAEFDRWIDDVYSRTGNRSIIVTGHSLGGGLAQVAVGMMRDIDGDKVRLVTFNAFKGMDLFKLYADYKDVDAGRALIQNIDNLQEGVHYRTNKDVVSELGTSTGGQQRTLYPDEDKDTGKGLGPIDYRKHQHKLDTLSKIAASKKGGLAESCPESTDGWLGNLSSGVGRFIANFRGGNLSPSTKAEEAAYLAKSLGLSRDEVEKYIGMSDSQLMDRCEWDSTACKFDGGALLSSQDPTAGKIKLKAACANRHHSDCIQLFNFLIKMGETREALNVMDRACDAQVPETCRILGDLRKSTYDHEGYKTAYAKACNQGDDQGCRENLNHKGAFNHFSKKCTELRSNAWEYASDTDDPCYLAAKSAKSFAGAYGRTKTVTPLLEKSCEFGNQLSCIELIGSIADGNLNFGNVVRSKSESDPVRKKIDETIKTMAKRGDHWADVTNGLLAERYEKDDPNKAKEAYGAACPAIKLACLRLDEIAVSNGEHPKFAKEICKGFVNCIEKDGDKETVSPRVKALLHQDLPKYLNPKDEASLNAFYLPGDAAYRDNSRSDFLLLKEVKVEPEILLNQALIRRNDQMIKRSASDVDSFANLKPDVKAFADQSAESMKVLWNKGYRPDLNEVYKEINHWQDFAPHQAAKLEALKAFGFVPPTEKKNSSARSKSNATRQEPR